MRGYDEFVGRVMGIIAADLLLLVLLAVTALIAAGWYWYPAWLPRHWPRPLLPRFERRRRTAEPRRRRATRAAGTPDEPAAPEPEATALSSADRLAAEGRYAEAIRERLRDTVHALTRAGVVTPEPGTTAHEITTQAASGRPVVAAALTSATGLFSEVWFGHRRAGAPEDDRMRDLTAEVRAALNDGAAR